MTPISKLLKCIYLVLFGAFIAGCLSEQNSLQRSNFAEVWGIYQACRSSDKLDELIAHARTVENLTLHLVRNTGPAHSISVSQGTLTRIVQPLKTRLAADPYAMQADCLLRTGQIAYRQGQIILAQDMFGRVLKGPANPDLHYYVDAARSGLLRIDQDLQATVEQVRLLSISN